MKTLLIGGARSGKSSLAARWAGERSRNVCCVVTATASDDEMSARIAAHRQERPQHWRVREEPVRLGAALRDESRTSTLLLVDCLTLWTANCLWPPRPEIPDTTGRAATAMAATAMAATAMAATATTAAATPAPARVASATPPTAMPANATAVTAPGATVSAATASSADSDLRPDVAGWQAERDDFLASLRTTTNEVIVVSNEVGTGLVPEHAASRLFRDEHGRLNQMVAAACDEVFLVTAGLALRLK
jgi:adenosyl cobinamide kinase/adenosyl cobinamide phosphate guanylyltransferase